jgi:hypothetical protein
MKLRRIRKCPGMRALLAGGFAFFLIKGLIWLAIGAFATAALV